MKKILLLLFVLSLDRTVFALGFDNANNKNFYDDSFRGWYAYEIIPDNKTQKNDEEKEEKKYTKPKIDWGRVWTMHPDEFNNLITDFQKWAIKEPTEDNLKDYLELQNIALERSKKFMSAFMYISQKYPHLSQEASYPVNTVGQDVLKEIKLNEQSEVLAEYRDNYALIYFYSSSCPYCVKQGPIIDYFTDKTGWNVVRVNIDENINAKLRFNIVTVPSIIIVSKQKNKWEMITSGIITFPDLRERIYRTILYMEGEKDINTFGRREFEESLIGGTK